MDGTTNKVFTATEKTKLGGIAVGATANDTDANLKSRSNHTGTQTASTISDFSTAADARVTAAIGSTVQGYDADLQTIGALSPTNDDIIQRKAGVWTNRTPAQVKTDLALTKSDVGLSNVDNTTDAGKPISTATQTALDAKAPLASPAMTGTPTAPTATAGSSTTQVATTAFVQGEVTANATPDATTSVKGRVQLAGDLAGSAASPRVRSRRSTTVGTANADYVYDAGMSPTHYSDAVNNALGDATSGEVHLRGESVTFTSASGKVVTPVSNVAVRGSGIDKTVISTQRTDYVFKNTSTTLANASLSDMTIDCGGITNVSGIDIRKFTGYRLARVKFTNSSQWFARFGNEPSASTGDIADGLTIEDCIFDTHSGIYEMLLVYNTNNVDINKSVFKNKSGTAGAAPVIGLWQKVNYAKIRNSTFQDLVSSGIYYAYTTNHLDVLGCNFINTGQGLRGANVSDNGKFSTTVIDHITVDDCNFLGGSNSLTTEAVQIGSVRDFAVTNSLITNYGKGIRIGFGNTTPTAADGGSAHYPSSRGTIEHITFKDINSNDNNKNLNSPIYFGNGGDFGDLYIHDIKVSDVSNHLDYAVIFNGGTTATASVSGGAVTGISLTNTFAWYDTAPAVIITGDGSNATATATIDSDGRITGFTVTNGGSGYTSAAVSIAGAVYRNINFVECDFGGKQIRLNDAVQIDTSTVRFVRCRNFNTSNLSTAFIDACVINTTGIIMHNSRLAVAAASMDANATMQIGDGSATTTLRHNNIRHTNSNDNWQTIFANFSSKLWTMYKNNTNSGSRRSVFDVDTGVFLTNGLDLNLGTDLTTGGIIVKRLTTTERNALLSPPDGTILYNSTVNEEQHRVNGSWVSFEPATSAGTTGQYYRGDKSWQTLDKTAIGLSNVTNNAQYYPGGADVAVTDGGTGASSATDARTNLGLGSIAVLSSIDLSTNVTGTLPVANGGTGVTSSTGTGSVVLSTSPTLTTPRAEQVNDSNGNPWLAVSATASAVNGLQVTNAVAGGAVRLNPFGIDANIQFIIQSKAGGILELRPGSNGTDAVRIRNAAGSTNVLSVDTTNARIAVGQTTPTAKLDVAASATGAASLRIRSGTAPTSPNDGDIWYDGTDLKIRVGGTTKTFTLT